MHLSDVEALRKVFDAIDLDKSGTIETTELREALEKAGKKPTDEQVRSCFRALRRPYRRPRRALRGPFLTPHRPPPRAQVKTVLGKYAKTNEGRCETPAAVPCTPPALSFRRGMGAVPGQASLR